MYKTDSKVCYIIMICFKFYRWITDGFNCDLWLLHKKNPKRPQWSNILFWVHFRMTLTYFNLIKIPKLMSTYEHPTKLYCVGRPSDL